jgi:hypothetical protein
MACLLKPSAFHWGNPITKSQEKSYERVGTGRAKEKRKEEKGKE